MVSIWVVVGCCRPFFLTHLVAVVVGEILTLVKEDPDDVGVVVWWPSGKT